MPRNKQPLEPEEGKRDDQERREELDPTEEKRAGDDENEDAGEGGIGLA